MAAFTATPAAAADIANIWDYTANIWGFDQADRYVEEIANTCQMLASTPKQGRLVSVRKGYLKYPVGRHLIFYRHSADGIQVIRVLHQSMDVDRHL